MKAILVFFCITMYHYATFWLKKVAGKLGPCSVGDSQLPEKRNFLAVYVNEGVDFQSQCHPQLTKSFVLFHEFALDLWKIQQYNVYLTRNLLKWRDR